jgi:hypothetical protein
VTTGVSISPPRVVSGADLGGKNPAGMTVAAFVLAWVCLVGAAAAIVYGASDR